MGLLTDKRWPRAIVATFFVNLGLVQSRCVLVAAPVRFLQSWCVIGVALVPLDRYACIYASGEAPSGARKDRLEHSFLYLPLSHPQQYYKMSRYDIYSPPPSQSKHSMLKTFAQETTCLLFKYFRVQVPKLGDFSCALLEAGINFYTDMKLISVSFLVHMLALQKAYRPLSHSRSEKQHLKKKSINKCPRRIQDLFGGGCC